MGPKRPSVPPGFSADELRIRDNCNKKTWICVTAARSLDPRATGPFGTSRLDDVVPASSLAIGSGQAMESDPHASKLDVPGTSRTVTDENEPESFTAASPFGAMTDVGRPSRLRSRTVMR